MDAGPPLITERFCRWAALALVLAALGACRKPAEPLRLKSIELGTAVDAENRVTSPAEPDHAFAPQTIIYASIGTEGSSAGTLKALWGDLLTGKVHAEQEQRINPTGPAHFEFHFVPPDGWSEGRHMIIFSLDGDKHSREFQVR
jgi:hypothetical protein